MLAQMKKLAFAVFAFVVIGCAAPAPQAASERKPAQAFASAPAARHAKVSRLKTPAGPELSKESVSWHADSVSPTSERGAPDENGGSYLEMACDSPTAVMVNGGCEAMSVATGGGAAEGVIVRSFPAPGGDGTADRWLCAARGLGAEEQLNGFISCVEP